MKKIIHSIEPIAIACSGLDASVQAQASISTEKDISELLGAQNETEDSIGGDCGHNESC